MKSKSFLGMFLVVLGILFIIGNTSGCDVSDIINIWWPVVIVIFGLYLFSKKHSSYMVIFFIIIIGLLLLAQNLNLIKGDFGEIFWPLVLVGVGFSFLFPRWGFRSHKYKNKENMNINSIFSSLKRSIDDKNFKGANASLLFGSAELDFTSAIIEKEAVLNIDSAFSSLEIIVPANWDLKISGKPIFGSLSDKRRHKETSDNSPVLIINYNVIFGSIEIQD